MAAKHEVSEPSAGGDREQAAPGGKGDPTHVHATAALIPLIVRNASDLIAFLDTEGRRVYNSPSYAPLLGDPENLVGSDSFGDIVPGDRERVREIFRETVRTGIGYRVEYRLLARDGTVHVVQSEGSAIRDKGGDIAGVVVVGRNVTEERRAGAQLDAALRGLKSLAEFSLFALREAKQASVIERAVTHVAEVLQIDFVHVLELEPDGKALRLVAGHNWPQHRIGMRISAGADSQCGRALELYRRIGPPALEAPPSVAIEDLRADEHLKNTFRVREMGVVSSLCVVIPAAERPYGTLVANCRTLRRFEPVEIEFMQAMANVLSAALQRCRSHAALQESEARFRSLSDLSSDWYWEQDAELRFSSVSEGFFLKSGMSREEVLGRRRWELSSASPLSMSWDAHRAVLEARLAFRDFEYVRIAVDGTKRFQSLSGEPVFDAVGRFTGYRGTGRDVTERRRVEYELRARQDGDRALIELGLLGLREPNPHTLLDSTVQIVAKTLRVELAKVLELLPDRSGLRLAAGVGWKPGAVGHAVVGAGLDSQAGYTIREHELAERRAGAGFAPIIVTDLSKEQRFSGPPLLVEHGVVSGVSVVIPGTEGPWGVLGVHSRTPRRFEQREAEFLQAAANLLSAALERCRSHAALQESEDRYRDLVQHSQDLICTHQLDGRIGSVNPWAAKVLGYELAELLNMNVRDVLAPERRPEFDDYIGRLKKDGVASGLMLVQTRTGENRLWKYTNSLRTEGVPAPVVRGMAHDVTEQTRAEAALRKSEERFKSLTELSSDYYWEQDEQFRFVARSGMASDTRAYPLEQVRGKTRWEIPALNLTPADWAKHRADLEAHRRFRDLEIHRPLLSGEDRWVSVSGSPIFDAAGRFRGYRGVGKDITERKRAEALAALEHTLSRGLSEAEDATAALQTTMRAICEAEDWECARYFELDEKAGVLRFAAAWGIEDPEIERFIAWSRDLVRRSGEGMIGIAWRSGEPVWSPDVDADPRVKAVAKGQDMAIHGTFAFPLVSAGRTLGVLAFSSRLMREPDLALRQALGSIGRQIGQFVQRKRAEEFVLLAAERIQMAAEAARVFSWIWEVEGDTLTWATSPERLLGPLPASGKYADFREMLHPDDRERYLAMSRQLMTSGAEYEREFRIVRTDGQVRWLRGRGRAIQDASGRPMCMVGITVDIDERKLTEQALAEREELLRATFDHAPEGIALCDTSGRFIKANRALQSMLGYSEGELRQMTLADLIHPEERLEGRRLREELIAGKRTRTVSNRRYLRKDGSFLSARVTASAVHGGDGSVRYTVGLIEDVTEQLRAEAKLRETREHLAASEARLRAFMDHSPVSMFIKDREGRYRHVNAQFLRNFGLTADKVLGRTTAEVFPREQAEAFSNHDARVCATRGPVMEEGEVLFIDGMHATFANKFPILDDTGEVAAIGGVVADITDRKRMEQSLRENRRLLARAQEIAGLGYWERDLAAGVARGSRGLRRMLGIPDGLPPQTLEESLNMIHPDDRERVRAIIERSIEQGSSYEFETRLMTLGGAQRIMLMSGEAVKDDAGRITKLIGTCLDITEQRRREEALCDAADQLQALSRRLVEAEETERRRLAAELHDRVGQNLTALSINLDILASRMTAPDADTARRLRDSLALLDATSLCVEGVLDDLRPPMLDHWGLGPTIRWVVDEFSRRTEIPVRVQVLGTERRIDHQHEIAMLRIVQEALNNVAKHASAQQVEITLGWEPDAVRVEVADDGVGFEHTGFHAERGLGIITMRERVQAANGRLNIDSAPGKGTRVRALIPR